MSIFEFYTPTHVYFGKKQEERVGEILKQGQYKKVLVHYGSHSAKASGASIIFLSSLLLKL